MGHFPLLITTIFSQLIVRFFFKNGCTNTYNSQKRSKLLRVLLDLVVLKG